MRFFAHAQPGFGPLLADEIAEEASVIGGVSSDGRNDVVCFDARGRPPTLRSAEDVFVEVAAVPSRGDGRRPLRELADALTDSDGLDRALSVFASSVRPLKAREGFRVIARVRSERDFLRSELRETVSQQVQQRRPRWRRADPATIELWVLETGDEWRLGLRLTVGSKARRTERSEERHGALRPSVAAAAVRLAGAPGRLLDPFCGTGTILAEAGAAGWTAYGADLDPEALSAAGANTRAQLLLADASHPPFAAGAFDAIVSNVPFGKQFSIQGSLEGQVSALSPLVAPGGCLVFLTGRKASVPRGIAVETQLRVEVLGQPAMLWRLRPRPTRR